MRCYISKKHVLEDDGDLYICFMYEKREQVVNRWPFIYLDGQFSRAIA